MARLDGNVLAGPLSEVFVSDMTMASGCCAGCSDVSLLALAVVEVVVDAERCSYVVRCHVCDLVLATLEQTSTGNRLSTSGLLWLSVPRVG